MTSNVGAEQMTRENKLGFGAITKHEKLDLERVHLENQAAGERKLREIMRPELLNRFDQIITFDSLSREEVTQILDLMIENLNRRLAAKGVAVSLSVSAKRHLIDKGYDPKYGARPLRRTVQDELETVIAEQMIEKKIIRGDVLRASFNAGKITLAKVKEAAKK